MQRSAFVSIIATYMNMPPDEPLLLLSHRSERQIGGTGLMLEDSQTALNYDVLED
eukprot:c54715_g1_i1 orf=80-244(+)